MKKSYSIYCCVFLVILSLKNIKVFGQSTSPTDYFRSAHTGPWNVAATWESSSNSLGNWIPSSLSPSSNANTITIRSSHNITITNSTNIDQVVIASGGVLEIVTTPTTALTIEDGTGSDIIVQSGGVFKHNLTGAALPTFNGASKLEIQTGGILEVVNNNGNPSNYATIANVLWADGSIFNWNNTANPTAGIIYFPDLPAIPIFKFSKSAAIGGTASTVINGLLEAIADVNFQSSGTKTFRNGITGPGKVAVTAPTAGQFIINGTTAILGGTGVLLLGKGLLINSNVTLTLTSNKIISNHTTSLSPVTNAGILIAGDYIISGTSKIQIDGTVKTTNINGLSGSSNTTFATASGFIVNTPGASSVIEYNRLGDQIVTTPVTYKNLIISGSGTKTASTGTDILVSGTLTITAGNTFALNGTNALKVNGGGVLNINANAVFDNGGESEISGGGAPKINIYGTFITRNLFGFTGVKTSIPGIIPQIFPGSTIEYGRAGDQEVTSRNDYRNLTLSGSGIKTLPTCNPNGTVTIKDNAVGDASNKTFGDSTTNLKMTGGRLKVGGTGTKPDISGVYTLTGGVIEFLNSGSTKETVRSPLTYLNIEITGSNVGNSKGITTITDNGSFIVKTGGVFENSGSRIDGVAGNQIFILEAGATFKTGVTGGFSGNDSAAVKNFETLLIDRKSTIVYSRLGNQTISSLPAYPTLLLKGTGIKTLADGTLLIAATADSVMIDTAVVFKINAGAKVDFQGRPLFIKSGVFSTGVISEITDGSSAMLNATNVTVERFIPAKRSFRFLSSSVSTSGSIKDNLMEGAVNSGIYNINDPIPGFGTNITGNDPAANGFDPTIKNNPSMFTFNSSTQKWESVLNTSGKLQAGIAYRLMVRGSRSTKIYQPDNNPTSSNTILRTTGTLFSGTYAPVLSSVNNGYTFVGNPYASPVDFTKIFVNATNISSSYYVWDPALGARGAYVVYNAAHDTNNNDSSAVNKNIQSGQAFFVQTTGASPSMRIQESYKSAGNTTVFRDPSPKTKLSVQLLLNLNNGVENNADGAVVFFGNNFSTEIGNDDSYKLTNLDENLAIDQKGILLSMEGLPSVIADDTIQLKIWQFTGKNYSLKLAGSNFPPQFTAYLKDQYLQKTIPVDLLSAASIPFSIDSAVSASYANDRFSIIFKTGSTLPVTITNIKAFQKNEAIEVDWTAEAEINIGAYEVELSVDGQHFAKATSVIAKNSNSAVENYSWLDINAKTGNNFYRIKVIEKSGAVKYSRVARVSIADTKSYVSIFPNPIKDNIITVKFFNMQKGKYQATLYNSEGQQILVNMIEHTNTSMSHTIVTSKSINKGTYALHIVKGEIITNLKVILE